MKKLALLAVLALTALTAWSQDVKVDQLKKDLRILRKIMLTSMGVEDSFRRRPRSDDEKLSPMDINTLYLKDQGVILTMRLNDGDRAFFPFGDREIAFAPAAPVIDVPEITFAPPDSDENFVLEVEEFKERLSGELAASYEHMSALSLRGLEDPQLNQELRALRREQREVLAKLREQQKIVRQQVNAKEISEDERAKILEEAKQHNDKVKAKFAAFQKKIEKVQEENLKDWNQKLVTFENELLDVLCDYGASLKSLPDNQRLTIILKDADRSADQRQDVIFVFQKRDLISCRDGNITVAQLKDKGSRYSF